MMWNVLNLVLGLVLLMYCLPTGESVECNNTDIIVGRLGEELVFKFLFSDLRDEYNKYITKYYGQKIIQNGFQIPKVKRKSIIRLRKKMDSTIEQIIYKNGYLTYLAGNRTEIFMTNDAFVVKKTKLQKEDAGIYSIYFELILLGQKVLIISDKPKIIGRSQPNPVLKPEDNYISIIQLECHSVTTSIGDCPLSMYTVWYRKGMRMTDLYPTLSQINVTVDHNGGSFTCLATDYPPCYQRLQTTKNFKDVLNIEECNKVFESETYIVQPEYKPIDVKLEPDQRVITVIKGEDLKVRCSAKCHPECAVKWKKGDQDLDSNNFNLPENMSGKYLLIKNIPYSYEGVYVCLVNNIHGETKRNFILSVTGESKKCDKTEIIVNRLGKNVTFKFTFSDLQDKYYKYITERCGAKCEVNKITIRDQKKESDIRYKTKTNALVETIIYRNGKETFLAGNLTQIFMTDDAFVVKKTKLQKQDAGIYSIYFDLFRLGQKALIITGKPTINGRPPPNPVLKPEDNYTSTIQLECHSVSTSIGDCPLSMYTVWYINGMRMTDLDPTLSQINVTVDHNGGNFTCLATDYLPCYQRLQTAKYYNDVEDIEECDNVFESETFLVNPIKESDGNIFYLFFLLIPVVVIVLLLVIEYRWPVVSKKRRESRRVEKQHKRLLKNIEERELKKKMEKDKKEMEERKKKMSESIEERELIKMEVVSKKRRESRRAKDKKNLDKMEEEKKEMLKKSGV